MAQLLEGGVLKVGAIHTYLELYGRLFIDLIPRVALVADDSRPLRQPLHRPQYQGNVYCCGSYGF
jgi:hypothetical protein